MKPDVLNKQLLQIKLPGELGRRTRPLDIASIKAEELRGFGLLYFLLLVRLMEDPKDRKLWAYTGYLLRAYTLPEEEFQVISPALLAALNDQLQDTLQKKYGRRHLLYNVHLLRHLEYIR